MIPLRTVALLFLRLGFTSFGGPAAHIALLHYEVVRRRRWISDAEFAELLAVTNLIPGPNSTEMAIHVGRRVAGWPGYLAAGTCFILPAALIVGILAAIYVRAGETPDVRAVLNGVAPIVIAIIAQATVALGRATLHSMPAVLVAVAAATLALAGVNELLLLAVAGSIACGLKWIRGLIAAVIFATGPIALAQSTAAATVSLGALGLSFLKIGSVLFGSGYVLVAFLRADLVERFGWLSDRQLLDAIAVGQVTPGPLFTTATFIGYLLRGPEGAVVATVAIFLPAFLFVALAQALLPWLRRSTTATRFVEGVVAGSLGLMAAVAITMARVTLTTAIPIALFAAALVVLVRWNVNSLWLVIAGGIVGYLSW